MEHLIKGKTATGKYYVRPVNWAGIWKGDSMADNDSVLVSGNTLFVADTEEECIKFIEEYNRLKVFRIAEYEFVVGDSLESSIAWYIKNINDLDEEDIEDIKEINIDQEGMWWETEDEEDIKRLGGSDEYKSSPPEFNDLIRRYGEIYKYIPFRKAIANMGEYKEPYVIASTEW